MAGVTRQPTPGRVLARRGVVLSAAALGLIAIAVTAALSGPVFAVAVLSVLVVGLMHANRQRRVLHWQTTKRLDQVDRQLAGMAGTQRDELAATNEALAQVRTAVGRAQDATKEAVRDYSSNSYRSVEALLNLYAMVPVAGRVPPMRGWAASPDVLLVLVELIRTRRPALLVETGSGVSTLWAALALRQFDLPGRVVALEHQAEFARRTREAVAAHGLADRVEVRLAPLEPVGGWTWYAEKAWADLDRIDLLFVDGPPQDSGPDPRYPALPLLGSRLAADATVLLDDMVRQAERDMVERWRAGAPAIVEERLTLEKGASILRLDGSGPWTRRP